MQLDRWRNIRRKILLPAFLGIAAVSALAWGVYQNSLRAGYEAQLKNMYTRSFYELVSSMDNVQVQLSKLMVSNSPGGNIQLLSDIARQSENAVQQISALPLAHPALSNTMGLVSLTGDYCRSLREKASDGHPLTSEDIAHLKELYNNCLQVTDELRRMQTTGEVSFTHLNNKTYYELAQGDQISNQFSEMDKGTTEYPTLIYDGPFSESILTAQPKGLPQGAIDEAGAKAAAATFLGLPDANSVAITGECKGTIETYLLEATDSGNRKATIQISKQGGKVLQMIMDTEPVTPALSADDCVAKAKQWLNSLGFGTMASTFQQQYDGTLVINFAATQDNAVLYTDLIKVKISMADGRICGFDAAGYWMNHQNRPTLSPIIAEPEARKLLSTQLQVTGAQLALIPTSGGGEQLCWEFRGTFGGDTFYVYIDAVTGEEANIFKIINTETGSLAV